MSWIGMIGDKHIAKKDIKVFKVLYGEDRTWKKLDPNYVPIYKPPFFYGTYKSGMFKRTTLEVKKVGYSEKLCSITCGFHSYSFKECEWSKTEDKTKLLVTVKSKPDNQFRKILQVFDVERPSAVFNCKDFTMPNVYAKVMECTIPAGAIYYENDYGEIVSDVIIVNKEIKL